MKNFSDLVNLFLGLIYQLLPLLMSLALLVFLWGMVKFVSKGGSEKEVTEGKNLILWGLIALFVMFSVMGIVRFFQGDIFGRGSAFHFLPTDAKNTK